MKMDDKNPEGAHDAGRDHRRAALPAYELGNSLAPLRSFGYADDFA
jgi:hypothetical protein